MPWRAAAARCRPRAGTPRGDGQGPGRGGAAADGLQAGRVPLRQLMDDRLLDALLERSRDEAGGLRLTGEGSMLGELVRAVLERALEAELTAHLGYERRPGRPAAAGRRTTATARSARRCRPGSGRWPGGAAGPGRDVRAAAGAEAGRAGRRRPG